MVLNTDFKQARNTGNKEINTNYPENDQLEYCVIYEVSR